MATSPRDSPPPNPAVLATGLPANRVLAGTSAVPARPSRFINARRPKRELGADVCGFEISAPFGTELSWIGVACIFDGFVFDFWFLIFPFGVSSFLVLVGFLLPVTGRQQVIDDEVSYFAAQPRSGSEVEAKMLAGKDAA